MPWFTQIVLGLGLFVRDWWILLLVVPALLAWWFDRKRRDPAFRARLDEWILHRKLAGSLVAKLDTARLMRTLGTLLKRSEEHTSELQSLMRTSYAVFGLKKKKI